MRRVLIVEDNRDTGEMLALLLEAHGHEVKIANDGLEALDVIRSFTPDIAFLDIGLPGMSGLDLVRHLRAIPALTRTPIVAVSGYVREDDRLGALAAGFNAHLAKPIDPVQVRELVERAAAVDSPRIGVFSQQ